MHRLECDALSKLDKERRKSVTPSIRLMLKLYIRRKLEFDKVKNLLFYFIHILSVCIVYLGTMSWNTTFAYVHNKFFFFFFKTGYAPFFIFCTMNCLMMEFFILLSLSFR